jgi:hypothetical protein
LNLLYSCRRLVPSSNLIAQQINNTTSLHLLRVLFDSGGTTTMINERALPKGCVPALLNQPILSKLIMGSFESKRVVRMNNLILPKFDRNKRIDSHSALVFSGPSRYDVILVRDFLQKDWNGIGFQKELNEVDGQYSAYEIYYLLRWIKYDE